MQTLYDLKQSLSRLYRDYEYSAMVIVTLSLTLAIALFLFTLIYTIQYKPLPQVKNPENVAWGTLNTNGQSFFLGGVTNYVFDYFRQHQTSLDDFGRFEERNVTLSNSQFTEQARGGAISSNMFEMLGVSALKGRVLLPKDGISGSQRNVVISHHFWTTVFNQQDDVIGETINVDGSAAVIVGVMPKMFKFPTAHDVWFADDLDITGEDSHGGWNSVFGRLKPGKTIDDVQQEFDRLTAQIQKDFPNQYKGKVTEVVEFSTRFTTYMGFLLTMLSISSLAILLMGCFSVCNMIIVRNLENAKEVLIKTALGVPRVRVIAALLFETLWLCVTATLLGIALCFLVVHFFGEYFLDGPYWWTLTFELPIALSGIAAGIGVFLITAVIPIWMALRRPTNGLLSAGRKGGTGTALNRLMMGFSSLQIFGAFILMVFTGVLIGGLIKVATADYGVPREGYLTAEVKLAGDRYASLEQRNQYYDLFIQRAEQLTGVEAVSVTGALPGSWGFLSSFASTERTIDIGGGDPKANEMPVHPSYFETMQIEILEGRNFTDADKEGAEEVAIINEDMAQLLFQGEPAAGRQFQYDPENDGPLLTVVGVVSGVVSGNPIWYLSPESADWRSQLYRPMAQKQPVWDSNTLIFKTSSNPNELVSQVKALARDIDSQIPLYQIQSFDAFLADNESGFRRMIYTFTPAALLALAISALGIYTITRRVVLQSTPDIGIMRAIGISERVINRKYMLASLVQLSIALVGGIAFAIFGLPKMPDNLIVADMTGILANAGIVALLVSVLVLIASAIPLRTAHKLSPRDAINFLSLNHE